MWQDWANNTAERLVSKGLLSKGICLVLGGSDTGKTTLTAALAARLARHQAVGIVDADIGQSHIGPPTTVGWAVVEKTKSPTSTSEPVQNKQVDFTRLPAQGISFVGDITPVGHLLQLTAAINECVGQALKTTASIIIDTPGLVTGAAASALWWTIHIVVKPQVILAVQRQDELKNVLSGLRGGNSVIESVQSPPEIPVKSPLQRRRWRQQRYKSYFSNSRVYEMSLTQIAVQKSSIFASAGFVNRLVGLRNNVGIDLAVGLIADWQEDKNTVLIKAPELDRAKIHCLIIGDAVMDINNQQM